MVAIQRQTFTSARLLEGMGLKTTGGDVGRHFPAFCWLLINIDSGDDREHLPKEEGERERPNIDSDYHF